MIQPDVIPTQHSQAAVPPPAAFTNDFVSEPVEEQDVIANPPDEQLYSNVHHNVEVEAKIQSAEMIDEKVNVPQSPVIVQVPTPTTTTTTDESVEHIDPIYQNHEDLTEYIEDTGVKAVKIFFLVFELRLVNLNGFFILNVNRLQCTIIRLQPMMRFHSIRMI